MSKYMYVPFQSHGNEVNKIFVSFCVGNYGNKMRKITCMEKESIQAEQGRREDSEAPGSPLNVANPSLCVEVAPWPIGGHASYSPFDVPLHIQEKLFPIAVKEFEIKLISLNMLERGILILSSPPSIKENLHHPV